MGTCTFELDRTDASFRPGEDVSGTVSWLLDTQPKSVELRLFWFTRGKGTEDVDVIEAVPFVNPGRQETRDFRMTLPASPYSFAGTLVSVSWALELVSKPKAEVPRVELVVAPERRQIQLGDAESE